MAKKKQVSQNEVQIQTGNTQVLTVTLLNDISRKLDILIKLIEKK